MEGVTTVSMHHGDIILDSLACCLSPDGQEGRWQERQGHQTAGTVPWLVFIFLYGCEDKQRDDFREGSFTEKKKNLPRSG